MRAPLAVFLCMLALSPTARSGFFDSIGDFFSDIGEGIVDTVEDVGEGIADFAVGVGSTIGDAATDVVKTISETDGSLGGVVDTVFGVVEDISGDIAGHVAEGLGVEGAIEQNRHLGDHWLEDIGLPQDSFINVDKAVDEKIGTGVDRLDKTANAVGKLAAL